MDQGHVPDERLAMLLDGELRGSECARIERHLAECGECARRRRIFAGAGEQVTNALRAGREGYEVRGPWLRTRVRLGIRARREERSAGAATMWLRRVAPLMVGLPVLALVVAGVILVRAEIARRGGEVLGNGLSVPDRQLTPGAVRTVGVAALCSEDAGDFDPELPATVRTAVFRRYGMSDGGLEAYQVDYLVSPQLGGTAALENLWPEPYLATEWNAHAKDALERRLRVMVCTGQVDLTSAQEAIRVDWIGAYRKYMGEVKAR